MSTKLVNRLVQEFDEVEFGDKRLSKRCQKIVKDMAKHPDKSIPRACGDWGSTQAAYRFFSNDKVLRENLLEAPIQCTVNRCQKFPEVLAIHDTTYLNFTTHKATEGLGPIGTKKDVQGLLVHHSLAVESGRGEVLGILHQEVWARDGYRPYREETRGRRQRDRESQRWGRGVHAIQRLSLNGVIHVADREGDIYEVLEILKQEQSRFVIRACQNRLLVDSPTWRRGKKDYLFESARRTRPIGKMAICIPARPSQKKRQAILTLRAVALTIRPPEALSRQGANLEINVIEAFEEHAPKGCEPLKWVLLTGESIETLEECIRVVLLYSYRWKIEEFHMGLKTGCKIEERQLETRKRLEAFLGLCSVLSVMLLALRDAARSDGSASEFLTEVQVICLRNKLPHLSSSLTAREALRAVAQLGGFLARNGDGEPGWRTLWRGMEQILIMEQGFFIAKNHLHLPSIPS